ncbi:restriction endonuclease subunit S [Vibrio splendidus]|uniref:restriction endonuclease subunit S n=1 Tax=Vibrio splendidus TaxID=29497 RepID=UPI001FB32B8F|nr:restriction endonuclease subunit S [Vibrio splendidus]UOE79811.1 restriction endonuclease subunit S [Vibrio splendidus]
MEELASEQKSALATGPFGSAISSKFFQENGIPVIRGGNLSANTSDRMSDDGLVFVSEEKAAEFKRSVVRKGDLIFTCWGTINQVGLLDEQRQFDEYIISNKQMKVTLDVDKADPLFVYYMFSGPKKQKEILQNGIGAAVPGFNLGQLREHKLTLPNINKQRRIASYLDSLDQKITLNNQINQTLEQMAQTLFKSWFVDFDPVKAKMNGEHPKGMDVTTASLFPEKLVESDLGLIPEGWEVKAVGDFTNTFDYVANGSFAALKENVELFDEPDDVLYIRTTDFNKGFKNDLKYTNESSYQFLKKSKLYGHETIISNVGDVGTVFRAPTWYDMPMTLGSNAMGVVAEGANSYIYYLFKSHSGQHLLDSVTSGSAQMKFNKTSFRKLRVVLPSKDLLAKFEHLEASLWAKHASNQKESLHLERLRDTLLPKLLSGEIDLENVQVKEAKAIVE